MINKVTKDEVMDAIEYCIHRALLRKWEQIKNIILKYY